MSDDKNIVYTPGMAIQNHPGAIGALGCFATAKSDNKVVLLSNAHVLFGQTPDSTEIAVHAPPGGSSSCCRNRKIATTRLTWLDGFHMATISISGATKQGYETDCAIAGIEADVKYSNTIPGIGMIHGAVSGSDFGVQIAPGFGQMWTKDHEVRMYSTMLGTVCYGTVIHIGSDATYTDGGTGAVPPLLTGGTVIDTDKLADVNGVPINAMVILPRPPLPDQAPDPSAVADTLAAMYKPYTGGQRRLVFGQSGDSGSIVVNKDNKVIGQLHFTGDRPSANFSNVEWTAASGIGFVSPIQTIMTQLGISIGDNLANATPSAGELVQSPDDSLVANAAHLASELRTSPLGRALLAKLEQHGDEARRIVIGTRRGVAVWHRHHGPAFAHHVVQSVRHRDHVIPDRINDVTRAQLLGLLEDLLMSQGSDELKRDVVQYRELAFRFVAQLRTTGDFARLAATEQ